ncbi:DMT family transporter [Pseudaquabacterium terrae]|uniref:DMT family transporter n=1 Tax=Pseudaquabacterium terrae TaxID=2732868 RepID=UPI0031B5FDB6
MTTPSPSRPATPRLGGVACIVLALVCFGALDTTSKVAAAAAPVLMALWVRYVVQTVVTGAMLLPKQGRSLLRSERPGLQLLRALLLITCNGIGFVSLGRMHVGEFTAIVMLTPLLLTVIAAFGMNERVSWLRWACLAGGFAGTLVMLRPGREMFTPVLLLPLVLVVANAGFQVLTSALAKIDQPGTIHLYSGLGGLGVTSASLPFVWQPMPGPIWVAMVLMGLFGALGHFLLIMAYARAPVAVLTPYLYLQVGFGTLAGWLVFSHVPDAWSLTGIGLIVACGVYGTWLTGREILRGERTPDAQSSIAAIAGADER